MTTILHYRIDLVGMVVLRMGTHPQKLPGIWEFQRKNSRLLSLVLAVWMTNFPRDFPCEKGIPCGFREFTDTRLRKSDGRYLWQALFWRSGRQTVGVDGVENPSCYRLSRLFELTQTCS